jgi:hypothetical protein
MSIPFCIITHDILILKKLFKRKYMYINSIYLKIHFLYKYYKYIILDYGSGLEFGTYNLTFSFFTSL